MANRRESELLFRLNAQLGSGYSSTFQAAQGAVTAMGREIQALGKVQSEISAYQKQQKAVEETGKKLENLQRQYDNIQREMKETGTFSSDLQNKLITKQQQIDKTSAALAGQTQRLGQLGTALREAGVDTGSLEKESARLGGQMEELRRKQEAAAQGAQSFGAAAAQAMDAVAQALVTAGIVAGLKEIFDAFMECVTAAGNFEAAMSTVEALSGASGEGLRALTDLAKELGATTKFTAQESADAMGFMAMAGWDTGEMLAGMDGVIQLAAASGENLALVSDIVTDSLSAFGLTAADTAHFSDVLAATATNANTNVAIMGETFKMSASIAGALGYSIEDVSVAVGLMANSGVKGSIAGTALRNIFNGLLEGVTLTAAAFGEYEYSAVRADGTMKEFSATIDELRVYFEQMTEAERVNNAMTVAGKRGYNGLLAILNATEEDYTSLTASVNECAGAAEKMASIKLDNMNGELTIMKSAWEALKITVGEETTPVMREVYAAGTDVLGTVNDFIKENPALVQAVAVFVGIIGSATVALTAYAAVTKVIKVLNMAAIFTGPVGAVLALVAGAAALTAVFVGLNAAARDNLGESWELTAASRAQYQELARLNEAYEETVEVFGVSSYEAQRLKWEIDALSGEFERGKQTMDEYTAAHKALMDEYSQAMDANRENRGAVSREADNVDALITKLAELSATSVSTAQNHQAILTVVDALNEAVPTLSLSYGDVVDKTDDLIGSMRRIAQAQAAQKQYAADEGTYITAVGSETALEKAMKADAENLKIAQEEFDKAEKAYYEAVEFNAYDETGAAMLFGTRDEAAVLEAARSGLETYNEALEESTAAYQENQKAVNEFEEKYGDLSSAQDTAYTSTDAMLNVISGTRAEVEALAKAYTDVYDAALESLGGQFALWEEVGAVEEISTSAITGTLQGQNAYWEDYNANLEKLAGRGKDIEGLNTVVASLADGSTKSAGILAGMAKASDENLLKMVGEYQKLNEQQKAISKEIAELGTGLTDLTAEMQKELETAVESMNLSEDAAESGRRTIQAFIDSAEDMLPAVRTAYEALGNAAFGALRRASAGNAAVNTVQMDGTWGGGVGYVPFNGYPAGALTAQKPEGSYARGLDYVPFDGYLAELHRGERVLTAQEAKQYSEIPVETIRLAAQPADTSTLDAQPMGGGNSVSIQFAPVYHLDGTANAGELEAVLRQHDAGMRDYILEVVEEAGMDAVRRGYR